MHDEEGGIPLDAGSDLVLKGPEKRYSCLSTLTLEEIEALHEEWELTFETLIRSVSGGSPERRRIMETAYRGVAGNIPELLSGGGRLEVECLDRLHLPPAALRLAALVASYARHYRSPEIIVPALSVAARGFVAGANPPLVTAVPVHEPVMHGTSVEY